MFLRSDEKMKIEVMEMLIEQLIKENNQLKEKLRLQDNNNFLIIEDTKIVDEFDYEQQEILIALGYEEHDRRNISSWYDLGKEIVFKLEKRIDF